MEERQEGLTKAQIAKELDITVRTLDRKRREGKIILTPHGKNRYMYTVKEETTAEPQERQEPQPQEAVTDQKADYTTALQSHFQAFRRMIDHELDFMEEHTEEQIAEVREYTEQQAAELKCQLAELRTHTEQQLTELRSYTEQQIAVLGRHIRTLVQLLRQLYEVENSEPEPVQKEKR